MRVFLVALFLVLVPETAAADPPHQYREERQAERTPVVRTKKPPK